MKIKAYVLFNFSFYYRCILGELFTKKPIFQANQELAQLELIRYEIKTEILVFSFLFLALKPRLVLFFLT